MKFPSQCVALRRVLKCSLSLLYRLIKVGGYLMFILAGYLLLLCIEHIMDLKDEF